MNTETVKRYIEAKRTKRQLDAALRDVNEEIENLQIGILEMMSTEGVQNIKVDGTTVFQKKITKVAIDYKEGEDVDAGYERTCEGLIEAGLGHLVKRRWFHQSVQAWVDKDGGDVELLKPILRVDEIHQLGVRDL